MEQFLNNASLWWAWICTISLRDWSEFTSILFGLSTIYLLFKRKSNKRTTTHTVESFVEIAKDIYDEHMACEDDADEEDLNEDAIVEAIAMALCKVGGEVATVAEAVELANYNESKGDRLRMAVEERDEMIEERDVVVAERDAAMEAHDIVLKKNTALTLKYAEQLNYPHSTFEVAKETVEASQRDHIKNLDQQVQGMANVRDLAKKEVTRLTSMLNAITRQLRIGYHDYKGIEDAITKLKGEQSDLEIVEAILEEYMDRDEYFSDTDVMRDVLMEAGLVKYDGSTAKEWHTAYKEECANRAEELSEKLEAQDKLAKYTQNAKDTAILIGDELRALDPEFKNGDNAFGRSMVNSVQRISDDLISLRKNNAEIVRRTHLFKMELMDVLGLRECGDMVEAVKDGLKNQGIDCDRMHELINARAGDNGYYHPSEAGIVNHLRDAFEVRNESLVKQVKAVLTGNSLGHYGRKIAASNFVDVIIEAFEHVRLREDGFYKATCPSDNKGEEVIEIKSGVVHRMEGRESIPLHTNWNIGDKV